jgi:hypothetical protein
LRQHGENRGKCRGKNTSEFQAGPRRVD